MLRTTERGLFCEAADLYIDPWLPVERAVITHGHGDHARWGSKHYLASREGARVLRTRLGVDASIELLDYGETRVVKGVSITLIPAGHILGSAQVRLEYRGEVWVVSGDYKTEPDPTCSAFEPVRCHTFITESTFGLPIYRWCPQEDTFADMRAWWTENKAHGKASIVYAYALGKAQRILAGMLGADIGPVYTHGAVERLTCDYRDSGVMLHPTTPVSAVPKGTSYAGSLIVAPPSAAGSLWLRRFGDLSSAFASGWMLVRGARRRRALDRGFVLSDHVDWAALMDTVSATGAECVWVTHGYRDQVVRFLQEKGLQAQSMASQWEGENDLEPAVAGEEAMA
ncbi:MAG: ligase-associated DNA damage response exonuclease [Gemmatimonadota bacterium]|nr:ligase-associated DNA damage response exonuclease [Gemmatimonadota bacterium]